MQCEKGVDRRMDTRRQESLGTIVEAGRIGDVPSSETTILIHKLFTS
jgi:hypothetical protein